MRIKVRWSRMPDAKAVIDHAKAHPVRKDDPKSGGLWLVRNPVPGSMITSCELNVLPGEQGGAVCLRLTAGQWVQIMTDSQVYTRITADGAPLDCSLEG